jgi:hypothetical protein
MKCQIVNGKQVYCDEYLIMFESLPMTMNEPTVCPCCGEKIEGSVRK